MTTRANQPTTGRDFVVNSAGDNALAGISDETPLADPYEAFDRIVNLDPPLDSANRASVRGNGTFFNKLDIPQFVAFRGADISVITFDSVAIEAGGNQSIEAGAVIGFSSNGVLCKIDGVEKVRPIFNVMVLGTDGFAGSAERMAQYEEAYFEENGVMPTIFTSSHGEVGFDLTGNVDDIFPEVQQVELRGEDETLINHKCFSPTPITYLSKSIEFFNINGLIIDYDPLPGSAETVLDVETVQAAIQATQPTTGSMIALAKSGRLIIRGEVLNAETITEVDGECIIESAVVVGDILNKDGGFLVTNPVSVWVGDLNFEANSISNVDIAVHVGALNFDPLAEVNGWINHIPYGNAREKIEDIDTAETDTAKILQPDSFGGVIWNDPIPTTYELLLVGTDFTTQTPVGIAPLTDIDTQILFGAGQGTGGDPVQLSAAGATTINETGQYQIDIIYEAGRSGSGGASHLYFRIKVDGNAIGDPIFIKLDGSNDDLPVMSSYTLNLVDTEVVTFEFVRDSAGNDSGGLFPGVPLAPGWTSAPSSAIRISRPIP